MENKIPPSARIRVKEIFDSDEVKAILDEMERDLAARAVVKKIDPKERKNLLKELWGIQDMRIKLTAGDPDRHKKDKK